MLPDVEEGDSLMLTRLTPVATLFLRFFVGVAACTHRPKIFCMFSSNF